uniref:Uncharacterized protein n=1 Tax=Globisporangium ultimum (strain ATCC 200006 / CBS 805.95 / DAOM BR144) TaxID=431595 RepID=K3W5Z6_GLOUD
MDGSLLQMPSNLGGSGSSSSYSMGFPNDLSPTGFGDLGMLDIDGTGLSSLSYGDQDTPSSGSQGNNGGGRNGGNDGNGDDSGDNADLMTFVEAL